MNQSFYHKLCIANILNGVVEGLSKYSRPSKVALIFAARPDDPIHVFDPQNVLKGHEDQRIHHGQKCPEAVLPHASIGGIHSAVGG
jgi:hypothetical protein